VPSPGVYSCIFINRTTAKVPKKKGTIHAASRGGRMPAYPIEREKE
jgi:hypothetical protein